MTKKVQGNLVKVREVTSVLHTPIFPDQYCSSALESVLQETGVHLTQVT